MRPSKDESESWYSGLDARMECRSLLVAQSSTYPFEPYTEETKDDIWSLRREGKRRTMFTLGNHKIGTIYDTESRPGIREILTDIKWKTIDVVRLGYGDEDISQDAVDKIHELMVEFHLPDVHAEIKTGRLFNKRNIARTSTIL